MTARYNTILRQSTRHFGASWVYCTLSILEKDDLILPLIDIFWGWVHLSYHKASCSDPGGSLDHDYQYEDIKAHSSCPKLEQFWMAIPAPEHSHWSGWGLYCDCVTAHILPLPRLPYSHRYCFQEHFSINFLHKSLHLRMYIPGNLLAVEDKVRDKKTSLSQTALSALFYTLSIADPIQD